MAHDCEVLGSILATSKISTFFVQCLYNLDKVVAYIKPGLKS